MSNSDTLIGSNLRPVSKYAIAFIAVAVALGIKLVLLRYHVTYPLSSSFLAAIGIAFWFGGTGPGLVAVILSSLVFGYIVAPLQIELMEGASRSPSFLSVLPYLIYFWLVALLMSWFSSSRRKAERLLNQARNELEGKVAERTADLSQANRDLQSEIVERRKIEASLREKARLLDLTHDSVFVRDLGSVITYWNRGAEEQYGWSSDEAVGQVSHQLLKTEFPQVPEEIMSELTRTGRWEGELIHTRRDGSQVELSSRWARQDDAAGRPFAVLETNNDITARKQAEAALHLAQAELAHISRLTTMGELVASIAHEVNQPLGAIVTNGHASLRLLSRDLPDLEKSREVINRMINDGMRASEVIRRIRELVTKTPTEMIPLNLNEIITEVMALAQRDIDASKVNLSADLTPMLPEVIGDRVQLQQVLLNLIFNARDAMLGTPESARELAIVTRRDQTGNILVSVRDSGEGLSDADLERIFDPFFTTKATGMGLGLSISHTIIEAHGGRLWASANPDRGATVQFTVPIDQPDQQ